LVVLELLPSSGIGGVDVEVLLPAVKKTAIAIMAKPTTIAIGIAGWLGGFIDGSIGTDYRCVTEKL
jgi:hypothetical protein